MAAFSGQTPWYLHSELHARLVAGVKKDDSVPADHICSHRALGSNALYVPPHLRNLPSAKEVRAVPMGLGFIGSGLGVAGGDGVASDTLPLDPQERAKLLKVIRPGSDSFDTTSFSK